jgi:hydroxymethylbilane synthase
MDMIFEVSSQPPQTLKLGTRGSLLAKTQSGLIASELEKKHKGLVVELVIIKTSADQVPDQPLHDIGGKGLFTKELEQALLAGEVDLAVHSFKDLPVAQPLVEQNELVIAAVPQREDPRDVLVSPKYRSIEDLPQSAKVGTGSFRRRCQLLSLRPDLQILPVRGNIDTRLRKLRDGEFDAIVLAAAGLRRCGLFNEAEMAILDPAQMLPAPAQGALALQCRKNDEKTREMLGKLDDPTTEQCVSAERAIVAALEGDCHSPIAVLAKIEQDTMMIRARVGARSGEPPVISASATAPADQSDIAVGAVLQSLKQQGVHSLLARSR